MQRRLHREWLVQELFVKVLLGVVYEDARDPPVVELGSAGAAHHLEDVGDGHVHVALLLPVVVLGAWGKGGKNLTLDRQ